MTKSIFHQASKLLIIVGWLFCTNNSFAKDLPLTSLSPKYQQLMSLMSSDPNQIVEQLEQQIKISSNPLDKAQQYLVLSETKLQLSLAKEALKYTELGLLEIDELDQPWLVHSLILAKADSLDLLGKPKKAFKLVNQALNWAEKNNDTRLLISALSTRGMIYNTLLDSENALSDLQKAYSLAPVKGDHITKSSIAGLIALVYEYRRENKLAIPYFEEAIAYHRVHNNLQDLGDNIYGLGRANKNIGNLELGKSQLQESVLIARQVNDEQGIAYGLKELAGLEVRLDNVEHALSLYSEALAIFEISQNPYMLTDVLTSMGEAYLKINQPEVALDYISRAELYADPVAMRSHLFKLRLFKANAYELQKKYKLAYQEIIQSYPPRLKLLRKQYTEKFAKLENKFKLDKLDQKNYILQKSNELKTISLNAEIEKNKSLILYMILASIILLLLVFILYRSKQTRKKYERLSETDYLTGLYNRRKVMELLDFEMELAKRHKFELCVAILDLDYFKKINDVYGHTVGDKVLVFFAHLCKTMLRRTDVVGRIGGEEFIIVLPHTSVNDSKKLLDNLRRETQKISSQIDLSNSEQMEELKVSVSIGICASNLIDSSEVIINKADKVLYQAKANGRNQIVLTE